MKTEIELHSNMTFKDGSTYSDSEGTFDSIEDIKEYVELVRNNETGIDMDILEYISFWDENDNEY